MVDNALNFNGVTLRFVLKFPWDNRYFLTVIYQGNCVHEDTIESDARGMWIVDHFWCRLTCWSCVEAMPTYA